MNTSRGKITTWLILALVFIGLGVMVILYFEGRLIEYVEKFSESEPPFNSLMSLESPLRTIKTFQGDRICDTRINEPEIYPDDCIAQLTLDSKSFPSDIVLGPEDSGVSRYGAYTFNGILVVKNVSSEMKNLKPEHIRCYLDQYSKECTLTKVREEDGKTIYRFSAVNNDPYGAGFIPVGIEIRLDDSFHIAAIDWYNSYWPNGYNYKKWGEQYRAVLVPLKLGDKEATPQDVANVEKILTEVAAILNQEAKRLRVKNSIAFTFENYPTCSIEPARYRQTIAGSASLCGSETGKKEWYKDTFTVLVDPGEECPAFQVVAPGVARKVIPATYGSGGEVCIAVGSRESKQVIINDLVHEFLHGFGAADHYDWLEGKDPSYQCNVSQGVRVCTIAAQEIGWR